MLHTSMLYAEFWLRASVEELYESINGL